MQDTDMYFQGRKINLPSQVGIRKYKKSVLVVFFLLYLFDSRSASALSFQTQFSLLTLAPGEELYSSFGHSAIRVHDPVTGLDKVYNYGTFDFNEPGFYTKFVRGKLNYRLSVSDLNYMLWEAQTQNRQLTEQVLNLSEDQKQRLYEFLETNALPENRNYLYDFFFDNCSTRIRDALQTACGKSLQFRLQLPEPRTFRQLLDKYLVHKSWADFGMDLGQGARSDRLASGYEAMFLPEYLLKGFDSATLLRQNQAVPFVLETKILYQAQLVSTEQGFFTPAVMLWLLFIIVAYFTYRNLVQKHWNRRLDGLLFGLTGILGLVIAFLWFGTDHRVTVNNWNLLWALPLHLPVAFLIVRSTLNTWLKYYFLVCGMLNLLLLLSWQTIPQELDAELIPWVLMLGLRAFFLFIYLNRATNRAESSVVQAVRRPGVRL